MTHKANDIHGKKSMSTTCLTVPLSLQKSTQGSTDVTDQGIFYSHFYAHAR